MGFAIAEEAARRGARVVVVAGAVEVPPPYGCEIVRVGTAAEMHDAVLERAVGADAVVMAAAVADYRPAEVVQGKLEKTEGPLRMELERTEDVLAKLGGGAYEGVLVGFAAEWGDPTERAREKLTRKGCDLVVGNDISSPDGGFGTETNRAVFVTDGDTEETGVLSKRDVAGLLLDRIASMLGREEAR
jgi:phosphopantothenoylcysteine decarboxylase/phosphopantothenate--cysteine ligase